MKPISPTERCITLVCTIRNFFVLLALLMLTACFATTDRLAVYEHGVLNKRQVDELAGHYHLIDGNGDFASLEIKPRSEPWPYAPDRSWFGSPPFFPQGPRQLVAADMVLKSGSTIVPHHFEGVAVFSQIPRTALILLSVPGETLKIDDPDKDGMLSAAGDPDSTGKNPFLVIKQDGKTITMKKFFENDEKLEQAFDNPQVPLPTGKFLNYLKTHAKGIFIDEDLPTYLRSTPQLKTLVEDKINAAFAEDRKKKEREKERQAKLAAKNKADADAAKAKKEAETAFMKAFGEALQEKSARTENSKLKAKASPKRADQRTAASRKDPTRITSIDSYYLVSTEEMTLIKVQKRIENGIEEIRLYDKFRASPYGLRHFQRNEYVVRGYWYPDSQQFYTQGWFENKRGCSGGWGDMNWSNLYEFSELSVDGKLIKTWAPSPLSLAPTPAGRGKKRICTRRRLDMNSCSVIRCLEWSDPRNFPNVYLVRSREDALLIYNSHFGNR